LFGAFSLFKGDLSIVEGNWENLVALIFCPVGNSGGVWSTAKNDNTFFDVSFILLSLFEVFDILRTIFVICPIF
jgi:hypothetical protein